MAAGVLARPKGQITGSHGIDLVCAVYIASGPKGSGFIFENIVCKNFIGTYGSNLGIHVPVA